MTHRLPFVPQIHWDQNFVRFFAVDEHNAQLPENDNGHLAPRPVIVDWIEDRMAGIENKLSKLLDRASPKAWLT